MLIAHRGSVTINTFENSLAAFKRAVIDPKYAGFELDVRQSKDHGFIINHDFIFHNKLIAKTNFNDLQLMGLASLEEVLKLETNKIIIVDIKDLNIDVSRLAMVLNSAHRNIYVMCYSKNIIDKIKPYANYFKCGLLNMIFNSAHNYKKYDFVVLLYSSLTPNIITYFSKNNILIFTYGITDKIIINQNNLYYIIDNY